MSQREVLYQGKFLKVVKDDNWEYVERGKEEKTGVVCVLPVYRGFNSHVFTDLVCQYRPPLKARVLSLVAGLVDKGETPEQAAKRELLEEAGLRSDDLKYIGTFPSSSGLTSEVVKVYIAFNCIQDRSQLDTEEGITRVGFILDDSFIPNLVRCSEGMYIDAKIYAAYGIYMKYYYPITERVK